VAPFGYRLVYDVPHTDGHPRARLEVHELEAEVVRRNNEHDVAESVSALVSKPMASS
jgi:hypothetical protein